MFSNYFTLNSVFFVVQSFIGDPVEREIESHIRHVVVDTYDHTFNAIVACVRACKRLDAGLKTRRIATTKGFSWPFHIGANLVPESDLQKKSGFHRIDGLGSGATFHF